MSLGERFCLAEGAACKAGDRVDETRWLDSARVFFHSRPALYDSIPMGWRPVRLTLD